MDFVSRAAGHQLDTAAITLTLEMSSLEDSLPLTPPGDP